MAHSVGPTIAKRDDWGGCAGLSSGWGRWKTMIRLSLEFQSINTSEMRKTPCCNSLFSYPFMFFLWHIKTIENV